MHNHLFLLRELVTRDFKARYVGSAFGFLWSFVLPIWQLLLFTFVFAGVMKIRLAEGATSGSFALFVFSGLLPWTALHEGVMRGTTAITDNAALVSKLRFPARLLIATVVLTALVHEAIAGGVFAGYLALSGQLSWATLPALLVAIPLQAALTLGLGLALATVHVFFRDLAQAVGMVLFGWFYLTPVVYPLPMVPGRMRAVVAVNPLTTLVGMYRWALLGDPPPSAGAFALLVVVCLLLLFAGAVLFRRFEPGFVDEL